MPPKKAPGSTQPKKKKKSILWDRDGVNGGSSSIELVIQWLITGNNYKQWRGDTEEGIRQKIADLQRLYNNACDFTKNTGEGILAEDEANGPNPVTLRFPATLPTLPSLGLNDDSEGSELPDIDSIPCKIDDHTSPKPKAKKHRSSKQANTRASKLKKSTTEDLYMKSIVSKRQAEVTRARANASKVKVAYMKELREHGLSLEEIELKAAAEFPPLADMDHDKSDKSENDSDDSA
ncbi:hypothetical protein KEM48_002598 [Puccinia striiformis f. sp. tritici PST-130]|nr:hypothetical protein KEM48_002598 [Puccinia striiformis f. sp. tritici PST-130]